MARVRTPALKVLAPLLGLLLLTFGLRVAGLEQQSIWVDEGFSIDFSSRTASDMTAMWKARGGAAVITDPRAAQAANDPLAIAVDIHPPLYYLLLHEWLPLAGRGEYAVRFPSVLVGMLLVLALYKLGASLGSAGAGLAAAGIGATAPFYVAYSQEARMYAPVALFSAFSLYFSWLVVGRRAAQAESVCHSEANMALRAARRHTTACHSERSEESWGDASNRPYTKIPRRLRLLGMTFSREPSEESVVGVRHDKSRLPAALLASSRSSRVRALWPWIGLVVSSGLALYTHYSAVLVIVAENALVAAAIVWSLLHRQPRRSYALFAHWSAAQLVQLALFFPWLRTTIGQVARYNQNLWVPNWQHELVETFRAFDAGLWLPPDESLRLAVPVSVILLAGLAVAAFGGRRRRSPAASPLPIMAGGALPAAPAQAGPPVGAVTWGPVREAPRSNPILLFAGSALVLEVLLALAAFQIRPEFHPRYLMVLATPYYVLLGLALAALWRRWRPAGLLAGAGLAAIFAVGLAGYELDPNFAKDDTRTLAQYLASKTTANDLIVMDAPEPLGYYYHGPAELVYVPGEEATAAGKLTQYAAGKRRVVLVHWFLSTSDPEQLMPFLLQKYGQLEERKAFRGYSERIFAIPEATAFELTPADRPFAVNFDNLFQLEAIGVGPAAAGDARLLPRLSQPVALSGQDLMLALEWRLLKPVAKDYKVSAYLTDDRGHLGGQVDLLLRHGQAATTRWLAGEEATAYYVLPTLPGLMPGGYRLNLALYPDGEQERLSVRDAAGAPSGGSATIASIDVLPPTAPAEPGDLGLARGVNRPATPGMNLVGSDKLPAALTQGETLSLTLGWQATAQPAGALETVVALQPDGQTSPAWRTSLPTPFPTDRWRAGDVFRAWYDVVVPPRLMPGDYEVLVGMGQSDLLSLGRLQVRERKRDFTAPAPEHALSAQLGGAIELLGYDQDQPAYAPGSTARITLYWRGQAPMGQSYIAFLHVLDRGRHVVSQMDAIPQRGALPTTAWLPGEIVRDVYELPLKPDLAPGPYQLETGFYRGDTGVRLKTSSADVKAVDDGLLIGTLAVTK